ncbi:uncharacterized protein HD556DRAFT_1310303, partial [Suillus plorans]
MVLTINLWFFLIGSSVLLVVPWFFIFVSWYFDILPSVYLSAPVQFFGNSRKHQLQRPTRIASLLLCGWFANGAISRPSEDRGQLYPHVESSTSPSVVLSSFSQSLAFSHFSARFTEALEWRLMTTKLPLVLAFGFPLPPLALLTLLLAHPPLGGAPLQRCTRCSGPCLTQTARWQQPPELTGIVDVYFDPQWECGSISMLLEFGGTTESAGLGVMTTLGVAEVTGVVWLGVMVATILAGVIAAGAAMAELDIAGSTVLVGVVTGMAGATIAELDIAGSIVLVGVVTGMAGAAIAELDIAGSIVLVGVVTGRAGAAIAELDIAGVIVLVGVMTGIVEIGMAEAGVGELVLEGVVAGVVEHDTVGAEEVVG